MTEFKEGDRVRIVSTSATHSSHHYMSRMHPVGAGFTVAGVGKDHGDPFVKDDDGFYWHPDDLVLADAEPEPCACIGRPRRDARGRLCDRRCPDLGSMDRGEPEPLKVGDAVLVWGKVDGGLDGQNVYVAFGSEPLGWAGRWVEPDAIVRPAEGQTPPWVEEPERPAEPIGLGAVVEATQPEFVGRSLLVRNKMPSEQPWRSPGGNHYAWSDLGDPEVLSEGHVPEVQA